MAVDSKINDVRVLVQGASATNISPNLNPAYPGSYGVTTSDVTGVSDHLELGGIGRLSVQGPVQSGNITHTPYMDRCLEMVIEAVWAPQAVLYVASPFRVVADPTTANSYVAQVLVGNGDTWHTIGQFALPPAPTRAYVRFLLTYLGGVLPAMITVTVIPEGEAPTDSTFTLSSSYEVPKYPLHVGAAQSAAVIPTPTQAWATLVADPMGSDAVSVDSRNWIWKDVIGLAGSDSDVDHLISANGGSLTISGCGVSATVQASGKARLAILGELFGKYATELQNAGYVAAQHYDGERFYVSVSPKTVDPYVGDHHKFRLNGTVTYPGPIAFNFADYVSTVQTYPSYRPPPAVRQLTRLAVYIPNPSESYTLRAVIQSDSSIEVNLGGGGDVAQQLWGVAQYQGFGPVSQPSPGLYVTEKLHAGYYTYSTLICTFRQILNLPPAVSKIYGLRVTNSSRDTTEFPLLPWPTSSVESPTPAAGADVWLNLTFEDAGLIDHSNFAHAKLVEGVEVHSPNRALSGGTRPAEDYCVSTGLGIAELAYEVDARDLNGSAITVETTLYISSDVVGGYMLALSGACYFHVSPLDASSASIQVLGWVGFGTSPHGFSVSYNAWHHVALVDDGTSVRTYLDGALYDEYLIINPRNFYLEPLGIARIYGRPDLNGPAYVRISEFVVTKAAKYAAPFTPHPLSSALYSSGGTGGTGSTDIAGAQYIVLDDWTTQGVGNEQALPPAAYGLGAAVFDDWLVQHAVTVDGSGVSLSGVVVLDDWALSGAGVAAMPTNLTGAVTLDDFVTAGAGVASIPIPGTGGVVLSSWVTAGNMLPLAPSEGVGAVTLGTWTSAGDGDLVPPETAQIAVTLPKLTMTGGGAPRSSAIAVSLPPLTAQARGGAGVRGVLPRVSVAASAVVVNVARTHVELPALTVSADGRSAHQGTAVLTTLGAVCGAYGGGYAHMALPALTVGAQGTAGAVARIAVSLPRLTAVARVSPVNVGRAQLTLPRLVAGSSARAIMTLPLLRVSASGTEVFSASYEAYALNLGESMDVNPRNNYEARNPQMTRYTNYPFIQIVRYRGAHYGVAADGLYLIGGDTDDGAPIAWAVDTCTTDFGSPQKKTVASVYLGGAAGPGVDFTIRSGETADSLHPYTTTASTALRNHRQRFGLGRRTRYYSIGLAGGGNIELDSLDFEVVNTSRRI